MKNSNAPSGIEPATLRLEGQCHNHLHNSVSQRKTKAIKNYTVKIYEISVKMRNFRRK
jgi:hypothetical protein